MDKLDETIQSAQTKSDQASHKMTTLSTALAGVEEDLRLERERVADLTDKIQDKEIAMASLNGKLELVTAELQAKVHTVICICTNVSVMIIIKISC